jgi:extracellular elastinolytic metalloproteinase
MIEEFWRTTNTTWGNNVFAHENWEGRNGWINNRRPEGAVSGKWCAFAPFCFSLFDPALCLLDVSAVHYNYTYDPNPQGTSDENMEDAHAHIDATVTQLFYTSNMFHDVLYRFVSRFSSGCSFVLTVILGTASPRRQVTSSSTTLDVEAKRGTL